MEELTPNQVVVYDSVTGTAIGPFDNENDAIYYISEVEAYIHGGCAEMEIMPLADPQEFLMDNSNDIAAFA